MKRVHKQRKIRDTILILTNGRQTEKNYFDSITLHYKSIYSIKCEFKNYQCDALVEYAISLELRIESTKYVLLGNNEQAPIS